MQQESSHPTTDSLIAHAHAQFRNWDAGFREQRKQAFEDLYQQGLTASGRAPRRIEISKKTLLEQARKQIAFYGAVAEEYRNTDMLSKPSLDDLREVIMRLALATCQAVKQINENDAFAAGESRPLPVQHRYDYVQACVLDVVNDELKVLETKGVIRNTGRTNGARLQSLAPQKQSVANESFTLVADEQASPQVLIRTFMQEEGYTVRELADELKVSREAMSSALHGGDRCGSKLLTKLANKMGIDPGRLMKKR